MKIIIKFLLGHKWQVAGGILILGIGGYFLWPKIFPTATQVKYITTTVERGALITSISGTGQVAASSQVDIKSKAGGDVLVLNVVAGQTVKTGALLAQIDAGDAYKSVRDAEVNLATAKLSLEKLQQPADALSLLQAENTLAQALQSKQQSQNDLVKAYDDGFNTVANAFLDLPSIISGLQDMLYGVDFSNVTYSNVDWYVNQAIFANADNYIKATSYRDSVNDNYIKARQAYATNFDHYKAASRSSSTSTINALITETYETTKTMAEAVKTVNNFVDFVQDALIGVAYNVPSVVATHQTSIDTFTGNTNSNLSSLLSITQTITNANYSLINIDRTIAEKTESLANLKAGTDALDLRSQQLSLQQKENALVDAKEKLANYFVRAPFDGVIAKVSVSKKDSIASGATIATIITKQQTVSIALNEVDIAKLKVGQKANITFDAIENLNITGAVAEVDSLGTVSQGVVSYNVKVVFDLQDERVKPGMSASALIIIDTKPDVLMVASSAVKSNNSGDYVEVLVDGVLQNKTVTVGSSNDTMTEIASGLTEGEEIISQKITVSSASSSKTTTSKSSGGPEIGGIMRL